MTFSPDVEQILREHGRANFCNDPNFCNNPNCVGDSRPTRQQLIEEAVRLWAEKQEWSNTASVALTIAITRPPCSGCGVHAPRYLKGEFALCETCYPAVKGLYTRADIEKALAAVAR